MTSVKDIPTEFLYFLALWTGLVIISEWIQTSLLRYLQNLATHGKTIYMDRYHYVVLILGRTVPLSTFFLFYLSFLLCPQILPLSPHCSFLLFSTCPPSCPSLSLLVLSLAPPLRLAVDINAQARKLQRNRAKGTLTLPRSSNSSFCRSLSETSLNQVGPHAEASSG